MRKPKKRQCSVCGEVKPLSEFYTYKYKGRKYTRGFCNACDLRKRRERYREKHPGGLTYDRDTGKLWLRKGRGRSLVWTSQMLSDLRRLFARTKNEELAGILGAGRVAWCELALHRAVAGEMILGCDGNATYGTTLRLKERWNTTRKIRYEW